MMVVVENLLRDDSNSRWSRGLGNLLVLSLTSRISVYLVHTIYAERPSVLNLHASYPVVRDGA